MATKKDVDNAKAIAAANKAAAQTAKEQAAHEKDIANYKDKTLRASLSARGISKEEYLNAQKRARDEAVVTKQKQDQAKIGKTTASLTQKINKLLDSGAGAILKSYNLTEQLEQSQQAAVLSTGDLQKGYNLVNDAQLAAVDAIKAGTFDANGFMEDLEEQFEGMSDEAKEALDTMRDSLKSFSKTAEEAGKGLENALNIDAKTLDGLEGARDKLKEYSAIASSPKLMGAFAIGLAVKFMTDFVGKALEVKQSLGVSAVESARIATNLKAASVSAKLFGGSAEQAEAAVFSLEENFGSLDNISLGISTKVGALTGQFGLAGDSAGKLLKSLEGVSGASLETNIELTKAIGQLARAEGVSPAKVLNDIAEDTETFAKFGKDGGRNIGQAAVQARKLGVNMATVAGIAESLLSFEESIEKQMEASVLLGRQLNLDKARELALTGDIDGLQKEIVNQVGSQADFEAMNVVQRQALADAVGVQVGDLAKIVAGDKTSAELAKDAAAEEEKRVSLMTRLAEQTANLNVASLIGQGINTAIAAVTMTRLGTEEAINKTKGKGILLGAKDLAKNAGGAIATLAKGAGSIFSSFGMIPFGIGIPLAIAAVASMYALAKKAKGSVPKLETGGVVKKTGMAEVHKGEAFSGTKNEMGFGASMKETERLLSENTAAVKQLTAKHTELMNTLTGKVGEMAMS